MTPRGTDLDLLHAKAHSTKVTVVCLNLTVLAYGIL